MAVITVATGISRYDNTLRYEDAVIINCVPMAGDWYRGGTVTEVYREVIDAANSDDAFQYDYYRITVVIDGEEPLNDEYYEYLVAVPGSTW
ncbi:MAG: hypothetical protein Q4D07_06960 [Selenomonadaceae bacterium]|nr:hypothetical protein [Selenomonadaceae bacterium]